MKRYTNLSEAFTAGSVIAIEIPSQKSGMGMIMWDSSFKFVKAKDCPSKDGPRVIGFASEEAAEKWWNNTTEEVNDGN